MIWKISTIIGAILIGIMIYIFFHVSISDSMAIPLDITTSSVKKSNPATFSIRMAIPSDITTLDPRQARDLLSSNVLHLLFSGLTRFSSDGSVHPELAESIECSKDGSLYTITLRKTNWSDGSQITTEDFLYSWQSMLKKENAFPNAHLLFWILHGKDVYTGLRPPQDLGVHVKSDTVFEVELEQPCPFFKELLTTLAFCPIQKKYTEKKGSFTGDNLSPSSGPYMLETWIPQSTIQCTKNLTYFASDKVKYDLFIFPIVHDAAAISMIERQDLDWIGSPLGTLPIDVVSFLRKNNQLSSSPSFGTFFLRVNCAHPPLDKDLFRKAISRCIDRKALVEHFLQGGQIPAHTFVPPSLLKVDFWQNSLSEDDPKMVLQKYCQSSKCTLDSIHLTLSFATGERNLKVAQVLQQDILRNLGLQIELIPYESKQFYGKISHLDYDLALSSWFPDYPDPHAFYTVFESAANRTNNTGWESALYQSLLSTSCEVSDGEKRKQLFLKMEQLLARDAPIIPLFHASFAYVKEASVDGIGISPFGYIDPIQP